MSVIGQPIIAGGGIASSEVTATKAQVLSGYTAVTSDSNDEIGTGTMTNNGAVSQSLAINGSYTIPAGYHNGSGTVTQSITTKAAATYNPSTSAQTIAAGQYLSGTQTIAATTGTARAGHVLSGYTFNSAGGIGLTGSIASQAAQTITPGTSNKTIASGKYLSGVQTIKGDSNLVAANILYGKSIFGVSGSLRKLGYWRSTLTTTTSKTITNAASTASLRYVYGQTTIPITGGVTHIACFHDGVTRGFLDGNYNYCIAYDSTATGTYRLSQFYGGKAYSAGTSNITLYAGICHSSLSSISVEFFVSGFY